MPLWRVGGRRRGARDSAGADLCYVYSTQNQKPKTKKNTKPTKILVRIFVVRNALYVYAVKK